MHLLAHHWQRRSVPLYEAVPRSRQSETRPIAERSGKGNESAREKPQVSLSWGAGRSPRSERSRHNASPASHSEVRPRRGQRPFALLGTKLRREHSSRSDRNVDQHKVVSRVQVVLARLVDDA